MTRQTNKKQNVTAPSGATPHVSTWSRYNRTAACNYAARFALQLCHDGSEAGLDANGKPAFDFDGIQKNLVRNMDCTHFVSCCIGAHGGGSFNRRDKAVPATGVPGGGLSLPWDYPVDAYGIVGAPRLVAYLLGKQWAEFVGTPMQYRSVGKSFNQPAALAQAQAQMQGFEAQGRLQRGDILVYVDHSGSPTTPAHWGTAEHLGLYMGNMLICVHSNPRLNEPFWNVGHEFVNILHIK